MFSPCLKEGKFLLRRKKTCWVTFWHWIDQSLVQAAVRVYKWFCNWTSNKQTYCMSDLTTWLTDKSDWSEQLLAVLPDNRHSDWHDWMTFWLTDDCWTYWYNWFSCTHLLPNCLTYLAYWLTNILTALLTKRHTNGQTEWLTELILYGAVRLTIIKNLW